MEEDDLDPASLLVDWVGEAAQKLSDAVAGANLIVVRGYLGPGSTAATCRIYFDPGMRRYVEVQRTDVQQSHTTVRPSSGLEYFWLMWDANTITYHADGGVTLTLPAQGGGAATTNYYPAEGVIVLRGYVGLNDADPANFRLYFDVALTHYLEIPNDSFRYGVQLDIDKSPLKLCYIWIDRGAQVTEHRTAVQRSYTAGLLEGVVVQDYLGGAVGAGADPMVDRPNPGGGGGWTSSEPGCPPSSGCASNPGGFCGGAPVVSGLPTCK